MGGVSFREDTPLQFLLTHTSDESWENHVVRPPPTTVEITCSLEPDLPYHVLLSNAQQRTVGESTGLCAFNAHMLMSCGYGLLNFAEKTEICFDPDEESHQQSPRGDLFMTRRRYACIERLLFQGS